MNVKSGQSEAVESSDMPSFSSAQRVFQAIAEDDESAQLPASEEFPSIEGYIIEARIGSGGGGQVFRAFHEGSQKRVAIKLLHRKLGQGSDYAGDQRIWRELNMLSQLRLAQVPQMQNFGEHDGHLYIVTDFVDGLPLDQYCREKKLNRRECVELLVEVAQAVQSLHQKGVIHRDIKPANILINVHDQVMIVDLGIATLTGGDMMETITAEGIPIGSPAFMAPEQARGDRDKISTRSDVYSLGATAYYILTGQTPFDTATTIGEAFRRITMDEPREPRELDKTISKPLAAILSRAVARDPDDRYGSAEALAKDLQRWLNHEPIEAAGLSLAQQFGRFVGKHPVYTTAISCITVGLLVLALTYLSVLWIHTRPAVVEVDSINNAWIRVRAFNGNILWEHNTVEFDTIRFAKIINHEDSNSDQDVILVAYDKLAQDGYPGELCVFSLDDYPNLVWSSGTTEPKIVHPELPNQQSYSVYWVGIYDIFQDKQYPGDEIVAIHRHVESSATVIRVYSVAGGRILYEAWHDGHLDSAYWMENKNLLILTGVNSEFRWCDLGRDNVQASIYPKVIFAVRPIPEQSSWCLISSRDDHNHASAVWYKCVLPETSYSAIYGGDPFKLLCEVPHHPKDPKHYVRVTLRTPNHNRVGSLRLLVDDDGNLINVEPTEHYLQLGYDWDPDTLYLGDLPTTDNVDP